MKRRSQRGTAMLFVLALTAILLILSAAALRLLLPARAANAKAKAELRESARSLVLYSE